MIDLSVVVVTWNTRDLVLECLTSIERARPRLAIETRVVDNGSSDGTAEAVRARFPRARLIRLPENRGFAAGSNAGMRGAAGRHRLLLNSDARVLPGALEGCVRFLDEHPDVAIVGPRLRAPDGRPQRSFHDAPTLLGEIVPKPLHPLLRGRRSVPGGGPDAAPVEVEAVSGAALFARSAFVESLGGLCEDYFFFLEETDWCRRARRAGWRVVHLPSAAVVHLQGASSKRREPGRTRIEYHRSLYRFFRSHHGTARTEALVALRTLKTLFYALTQTPAALLFPRLRERARAQRAVLAWHLRGRPDDAGLASLPARPGGAAPLEAGRGGMAG